jgi:hypothetical protein
MENEVWLTLQSERDKTVGGHPFENNHTFLSHRQLYGRSTFFFASTIFFHILHPIFKRGLFEKTGPFFI